MIKAARGQKMDTVIVLIVFCIFAASVLIVLTLGGSIYKNMTDMSQDGYNEQTCLSYIWSKVKNGDEAGKIHVGDFHGLSVLCIDEEYGGISYQTMIYLYDGWVRELFSESTLEFSPENGIPVIEVQSFSLEQLESGLIKATSGQGSLLIFPRAAGVEPNAVFT